MKSHRRIPLLCYYHLVSMALSWYDSFCWYRLHLAGWPTFFKVFYYFSFSANALEKFLYFDWPWAEATLTYSDLCSLPCWASLVFWWSWSLYFERGLKERCREAHTPHRLEISDMKCNGPHLHYYYYYLQYWLWAITMKKGCDLADYPFHCSLEYAGWSRYHF